jgi:hypothetical protein
MADTQPAVKGLSAAVDLSKAARNKRRRRNRGSLDRLRSLFHFDPVGVSLKFAAGEVGDGKRALLPVLCFSWTYDRGAMMFPDHRTIHVPATELFVPPNIEGVELLAEEKLVEEGIRFLQRHALKLVASNSLSPVLRLECRIRKKSSTVASMTFQTDRAWLAKQQDLWRGL